MPETHVPPAFTKAKKELKTANKEIDKCLMVGDDQEAYASAMYHIDTAVYALKEHAKKMGWPL